MSAEILRTDGTREQLRPANGRTFKLRELQAAVGGYIQVLFLPDDRAIVFDEEGKSKDYAPNPMATLLLSERLSESDQIVGNAVLCPRSMLGT